MPALGVVALIAATMLDVSHLTKKKNPTSVWVFASAVHVCVFVCVHVYDLLAR